MECKWIRCSERLPDELDSVLVTRMHKKQRYIDVALYSNGTWVCESDEYLVTPVKKDMTPIAWMKMPEPYQGDV